MRNVGIIGLGEYLPEKILTNSDLEKMVDTSDEWITTRTGIKQRRIVAQGQASSDLATNAARQPSSSESPSATTYPEPSRTPVQSKDRERSPRTHAARVSRRRPLEHDLPYLSVSDCLEHGPLPDYSARIQQKDSKKVPSWGECHA